MIKLIYIVFDRHGHSKQVVARCPEEAIRIGRESGAFNSRAKLYYTLVHLYLKDKHGNNGTYLDVDKVGI